jgi:hypothetical protein
MTDPPVGATHASQDLSRKFRNGLLKLMAVSAGLMVGIGILAIAGYWVLSRPKVWNSSAITAKFKQQVIYENHEKPTEVYYYVNVYFDVTNNTGSDYVLPVDAWQNRVMETQSGSLLGSAGWKLSLMNATLPETLPRDFFDPKPISLPAHTTVELLAEYDFAYVPDAIKGRTKEQVVGDEFRHTDELVVFDDTMHYRINFPMKGIAAIFGAGSLSAFYVRQSPASP